MLSEDIIGIAFQQAQHFLIDPHLVMAIITVESGGNRFATRFESGFLKKYINPLTNSYITQNNPEMIQHGVPSQSTERRELATSWGLMQIMGQTARVMGFRGQYLSELTEPAIGIHFGCAYLETKIRNHDEIEKAISAYNAGFATDRNKDYVDRVMKTWRELEKR